MATIRKRGNEWQCIVRRDSRTASKSFVSKRDAVEWGNTAEAQADAVERIADKGACRGRGARCDMPEGNQAQQKRPRQQLLVILMPH